jgi:hypothetical protein
MMAAVSALASVLTFQPRCPRCGCLRNDHVQGRCRRDVVIGRDVEREARMARLATLQRRIVKVRPFGLNVERM